jgi:hypothetical protein
MLQFVVRTVTTGCRLKRLDFLQLYIFFSSIPESDRLLTLCPRVEQPEPEAEHCPPVVEIKNVFSLTATPQYSFMV